MKKIAFTLAEVLITLGIIGIVAAMTLPSLIGYFKKTEIETRLERFYSVANNALVASQAENESWDHWYFNSSLDPKETAKWYNTYLKKYWKTVKNEELTSGYIVAYFPDGSLVIIKSGVDYFYYPDGKKYTFDNFSKRKNMGKDMFPFSFYPQKKQSSQNYKKGIQPYISNKTQKNENGNIVDIQDYNYTIDELYSDPRRGCRNEPNSTTVGAYCTQVIFQNGWKIPQNYPYKF